MSKTCANCAAEVPEGAGFCDNCGMPVSEVPPRETANIQQGPTAPPTPPPPRPSSAPPPAVERPASDPPPSQEALRWEQPPPVETPSSVPPPPRQGGRPRRGLLILGGLVAFVGIGIAIWLLVSYAQGGNEVAKGPPTEEAPKPAPGYQLVDDGSGNLTVEVPSGWEVIIGDESEGEPSQQGWSTFTDTNIGSSITASSDLEAWNTPGGAVPGIYAVASRELAQEYTNSELTTSGPNDGSRYQCERGENQDLNRSPYSGRIQAWDCSGNGDEGSKTLLTLSAAPQDRECAVTLHIWSYDEADREVAQHILDTFEVDCGGI